ncbi:glucose 1-dehydrogenase [Nocardia sp. CDC159]|uniref:Glucose 1-dehydrogenase n=1 Tax=Nocardia pulmonis TaxID=2951408 RepID=A0A9X2E971_9NOCA|nr:MULTISPECIES: glucose 1-dehydrogenase [Nocardia]MCM6776609.1 glucose 1-dehydrogenase [Nocardia pulmonis]MCM6789242.1 glucose 1-dehydrogenase [Nocardia sp. CDC159]
MNDSLLGDKVALITGAASGIGAVAARVFTAHGAKLVLADLNDEKGNELAAEIENSGGEALFVHTDVSSEDDVAAMMRAVVERFGRLDCAFNNAGIDGHPAIAHEVTRADWDRMLAVNLTGVWLCLKYELPQMLSQGGGAIVNTASVAGLRGSPRQTCYTTAKHGLIGLTMVTAVDYAATGIRVNAICPGTIHTPMLDDGFRKGILDNEKMLSRIPMARHGEPEEIAEAAAWLLSDGASYVTGQALPIDGGWTTH